VLAVQPQEGSALAAARMDGEEDRMNRPDVRQTVIGSVGALASGAAIVSFTHTYGLARAAHQTAVEALVYPVLTDVLVLSATVCLLYAARHKIRAVLPRWAFALGVIATVAANTGDYFRPIPVAIGAVVSGWSAVAFIFGVLLAHWFWNNSTAETLPAPIREAAPAAAARVPVVKEGNQTGNLPVVSKTGRVLAELQTARAKGENPTAADLVKSLLEQGHEISPTLARNVVRDNKVTSNGHAS
jgi:hypothetical protein